MKQGHTYVCFTKSTVTAINTIKFKKRVKSGISTRRPPEPVQAQAPALNSRWEDHVTCVVGHGCLVSVTLLLEDDVAELKNPRDDPQQALGCNQRQLRPR